MCARDEAEINDLVARKYFNCLKSSSVSMDRGQGQIQGHIQNDAQFIDIALT